MTLDDELRRAYNRRPWNDRVMPLPQALDPGESLDELRQRQLASDPTRAMIHAFNPAGERASWLAALRHIRNLTETPR